jgi:hypothetical protein
MFNFVKIMATKRKENKLIFPPPLFVLVGSGIRNGIISGSGIRDKHPRSATLLLGLAVQEAPSGEMTYQTD